LARQLKVPRPVTPTTNLWAGQRMGKSSQQYYKKGKKENTFNRPPSGWPHINSEQEKLISRTK
jgi:hypothetical protein